MVVGGGMRANTETSRSSARAGAATTMSIRKKERKKERRLEIIYKGKNFAKYHNHWMGERYKIWRFGNGCWLTNNEVLSVVGD